MRKANWIGIYLLACLLVFSGIPVAFYMMQDGSVTDVIKTMVFVACAGGIGGTIYSIRGFYRNIADQEFSLDFAWWYIFRPIISAVVGVFIYFLIVGGLLSISATAEIDFQRGVMLHSAISFIAGYGFARVTEKLDGLAGSLFKTDGNNFDDRGQQDDAPGDSEV